MRTTRLHPILSQAFDVKARDYNKRLAKIAKRKGHLDMESTEDRSAPESGQERIVESTSSTRGPSDVQEINT